MSGSPVKLRSIARISYELMSKLLGREIDATRLRLGYNIESIIEETEATGVLPYPVIMAEHNMTYQCFDFVLNGGWPVFECQQIPHLGLRCRADGSFGFQVS